jgi:hypothetical protein
VDAAPIFSEGQREKRFTNSVIDYLQWATFRLKASKLFT